LKLLLHNVAELITFLFQPGPSASQKKSITSLKGVARGRYAVVLGNGPSLDLLAPDRLTEIHDVFVVNDFYKHKVSVNVRPSFYVLSDNIDVENFSNDPDGGLAKYILKSNSRLVLPHTSGNLSNPANIRIHYFDDRQTFRPFGGVRPDKPRSYISVTLYKALALAQYMGYERIYVLGLDNTEFVSYRGTIDNLIFRGELSYADLAAGFEAGARVMKEFEHGMAGRMQSYSHLFGDLFKFDRNRIIQLDQHSIVDAFNKVSEHPLIKKKGKA
jgi:hypothetical protein